MNERGERPGPRAIRALSVVIIGGGVLPPARGRGRRADPRTWALSHPQPLRWSGGSRTLSRAMTTAKLPKRLGFFTRLLDQADPAERYRLATAQIVHAERCGFDSAWVAQHHFHEDEGGLPAPFVFLAQVAAQTSRIRLGTGDRDPAAGAADPGGRGRRGARPDVRRPPGGGRRTRRQPLGIRGVRPGQRRARDAARRASPGAARRLGRAAASRRGSAVSGDSAPGRAHLAGDVHGGRGPAGRRGGRRSDAVAHAAAAGRARPTCRWPRSRTR